MFSCDVLTLLMSTIASKLIFRISRCVLDDKQLNLYLNMVETIMCIKNWVTSKLQKHVPKNIFDNFKNLGIKDH